MTTENFVKSKASTVFSLFVLYKICDLTQYERMGEWYNLCVLSFILVIILENNCFISLNDP